MEKLERIKEYLLDNEDVLKDVVREINSYNGALDYLDYFENDEEFFSMFFTDPMEAVRATQYGDYNFTDDYVRFNAYGNLDSCDEWALLEDLKDNIDEIIEQLIENANNLYLDNELTEILEDEEEDEE